MFLGEPLQSQNASYVVKAANRASRELGHHDITVAKAFQFGRAIWDGDTQV